MSYFDRLSGMMEQAVGSALKSVRESVGDETDPDLNVYERLSDEDFEWMVKEYGRDEVMRYIETMENKRLMRRQHAA